MRCTLYVFLYRIRGPPVNRWLQSIRVLTRMHPDIGADEYLVTLTLSEALKPKNYLAYEWEGKPLPILHGFPLRAVFPDLPGGQWVKWLLELVVK